MGPGEAAVALIAVARWLRTKPTIIVLFVGGLPMHVARQPGLAADHAVVGRTVQREQGQDCFRSKTNISGNATKSALTD